MMISTSTRMPALWLFFSFVCSFATEARDMHFDGHWRTTGLTTVPGSALNAQVCIEFVGNKVTEEWFMYSATTKEQQASLGVKAIEVKYKIGGQLSFSNVSEGLDSTGMLVFKATRVYDVNVHPDEFQQSMTDERMKYVGRHRRCLYEYLDTSMTRIKIHCNSLKPINGFYRYGEKPSFPVTWPTGEASAIMTKGSCNELKSLTTGWPKSPGYRIHITFAGTINHYSKDNHKSLLLRDLADTLHISQEKIFIVSSYAGSFIVNFHVETDRDVTTDKRLKTIKSTHNDLTNQKLGKLLVISMSYEYVSGMSDQADEEMQLPALPVWVVILLYSLGTVICGIAFCLGKSSN